ncbi:MAG: nitroreductase family deazaflavin-dependent oxidoreductase [Acidimicrobiia bacterium]|nr:nitroreductase family deazaflavin-dependent oxidoreductase [Acidimicrobiia bacterium]
MADNSPARSFKTPPRWMIPWISRAHVRLYRRTDGRIGGKLAGMRGVLVTTTGRRSGHEHTVCLPYFSDDGDRIVVASFAGAPTHPAWYVNMLADPAVTVRERARSFPARAETVIGDDRAGVWERLTDRYPWYLDYQSGTEREIPLVRLVEVGDDQ